MKVHEYQAKEIFGKYGIPIPKGKVAKSVDEVIAISQEVGIPCVIKSQVHVGGRGKAGGIKIANNEQEVREYAAKILGMEIKGLTVKKVLVASAIDIANEAYLGIINDRTVQIKDECIILTKLHDHRYSSETLPLQRKAIPRCRGPG